MALGFRRENLKRCRYDDLMKLAKVLGLDLGLCPPLGALADACAREMIRQGGPKPPSDDPTQPR